MARSKKSRRINAKSNKKNRNQKLPKGHLPISDDGQQRKLTVNLAFNLFAKKISDLIGNAWVFVIALILVLVWGVSGSYYQFSDTWQLIINTTTSVITFLIVILIQNTQNRDTEIINLKIDELIRAKKGARNTTINLEKLSDNELKKLEQHYIKLCNQQTGR